MQIFPIFPNIQLPELPSRKQCSRESDKYQYYADQLADESTI